MELNLQGLRGITLSGDFEVEFPAHWRCLSPEEAKDTFTAPQCAQMIIACGWSEDGSLDFYTGDHRLMTVDLTAQQVNASNRDISPVDHGHTLSFTDGDGQEFEMASDWVIESATLVFGHS